MDLVLLHGRRSVCILHGRRARCGIDSTIKAGRESMSNLLACGGSALVSRVRLRFGDALVVYVHVATSVTLGLLARIVPSHIRTSYTTPAGRMMQPELTPSQAVRQDSSAGDGA